jgi:hypothetical protein
VDAELQGDGLDADVLYVSKALSYIRSEVFILWVKNVTYSFLRG